MRARALLLIRDLFGDYGGERLRRHPGTGENPGLLHRFGGGHDHHRIHHGRPADFEEQGDVENDHGLVVFGALTQERVPLLRDKGMNDGLQPFERSAIAQNRLSKRRTVHDPLTHRSGKGRLDQRRSATGIERVNAGVRIMHGDAPRAEKRRRRRLAHANGARETENHHDRLILAADGGFAGPRSRGEAADP